MKKAVLAVIIASSIGTVLAEPVIGSNATVFVGIPATTEMEYNSAVAFEVSGDVFINENVYGTASLGSFTYGIELPNATVSASQGAFKVGAGYEHSVQENVSLFGEAKIGKLSAAVDVDDTEMFAFSGRVIETGVGVRSKKDNFSTELMMSRRSETYDGFDSDVNFAIDANLGFAVKESLMIGLKSKVDLDFENRTVGLTAGFKF